MKLEISFADRFGAAISGEIERGGLASAAAMRAAGELLKTRLRTDLRASGIRNPDRIGNTIRSAAYPKRGGSLNAAAIVYAKSPQIVRGLTAGEEIVPAKGRFLVIPNTEVIGRRGRKRWTLRDAAGRFGALSFVARPGGGWFVLATLRRGATGRLQKGSARARRIGTGFERVLLFTLVPSVRLRRRLDVEARLAEIGRDVPGLLAAALSRLETP